MRLRGAIAANTPLALLVFMGIYAASVALSLPGAGVLTLAGGFLFGWFLGGVAAIIAATAGAAIIFLIAKTSVGELLAARAGPWLERLRDGFQENAFSYLLFLRLVPIFPFWLVNLAPALLGVSFSTYVLATVIGIIPGSFAYAIAGKGLDSVIAAQQAMHQSCLAKMGPDAEKLCPFKIEPWSAADAWADRGLCCAWRRGVDPHRGQALPAQGRLKGVSHGGEG